MDVFEAVYGRRSIRAFSDREVSEEELKKILEAACQAPSAGNIQPWEFVIVREKKRKIALAKAALGQYFIAEAPVVIVVCANQIRSASGYGIRGSNMHCLQDTAAAIENMLLCIYALGLGACWVGAFNDERVATAVEAPEGVRPVAIIPIGHPAEEPLPTSRRSLKEIVHHESF